MDFIIRNVYKKSKILQVPLWLLVLVMEDE